MPKNAKCDGLHEMWWKHIILSVIVVKDNILNKESQNILNFGTSVFVTTKDGSSKNNQCYSENIPITYHFQQIQVQLCT